jgi:hypothetical protein
MTTDRPTQLSETALPDSTDRWTPELADRPTDSRDVTDLDFTRSSKVKTCTDGQQDHDIRSVGRSVGIAC